MNQIPHPVSNAYERIRRAILSGELIPGTVISQLALTEKFGVTSMPLREALRLLKGEGLVQIEPHQPITVVAMSAAELEQLWAMRVALEAQALRLSMPRMTAEDLGGLAALVAEMNEFALSGEYLRWTAPHRAFHRALTALAGARIATMLAQWFDHTERYRRLFLGHGFTTGLAAGHEEILGACEVRAPDLGAGWLASHLAETGFQVIGRVDPDYEPVLLQAALSDVGGCSSARALARRG